MATAKLFNRLGPNLTPKQQQLRGGQMEKAIVMDGSDNVATALDELQAGDVVSVPIGSDRFEVTMKESVSFGHKFALINIDKGNNVIKYGEVIGRATAAIEKGCHVHVHNIESLRGRGDLT
jgi:altronate dehydratase small subunit